MSCNEPLARLLWQTTGLLMFLGMMLPLAGHAEEGDKEILYWVAPMDPNYRRDKPGKSPMGMDLIPVYADGEDSGSGIRIKPEVTQNLGVRTAVAERSRLWRLIDTVGYVDFDESRLSHVHLRTKGWIEKLYVESEGERVRKGDPLLDLYSPELVNAQEEFVQAMRSGSRPLLRAARDRLLALGIPEDQIGQLAKTRKIRQTVTIYAPQTGMVATLPVRDGMYVTPATRVMSLADLASVWILGEVFERQVDWVKLNNPVDVSLSFLPGRVWEGKVEYIYPSLDPKTRTLKVRMRFNNPDEKLKPNMYTNVKIYGGPLENVIVIPLEALIRSGREERVIVALGEGRFEARPVKAGIESGDWVEIINGLQEGEKVVTSGQFLIDSEASLKASMMRMAPAAEAEPAAEEMSGMDKAEIAAQGVIESVMPEHGMLKLQHDPIPALDWPSMTMDFRVAEGVDLTGLAKGERVEFSLQKQGDSYVVTAIRKLQ